MQSLDLAPFFDVETGFAQAATLDGRDVVLILSEEYKEVFLGESPISGREYVAHMLTGDLGSTATGSALVIGTASYVVRSMEAHASGSTAMRLEKQ